MSAQPTARTALSHVWPPKLPKNHGQPGPFPAKVQPGSALGGHRGVPLWTAQQEGPAPQEVYQDCRAVSGTNSLMLPNPRNDDRKKKKKKKF